MKRKAMVAILIAVLLVVGAVSVLAMSYSTPQDLASVTARFNLVEPDASGDEFAMVSEDGELVINITNNTQVYFEDYVPLSDECEGLTRDAREVLFGRTLAEVLDGRNLRVVFEESDQIEPVSITILFEKAVTLPQDIDLEGGYAGIMTLPGEIDWENGDDGYSDIMTIPGEVVFGDFDQIHLNGEVVVNSEILEGAPSPFLQETESGDVVMVPLAAVAQSLGYDVSLNEELQSIQLGVGIQIWLGSTEAHLGRMAPIELSAAPALVNDVVFAPLDFFRNVLGQTAYVFEGQVVIETYSDMM